MVAKKTDIDEMILKLLAKNPYTTIPKLAESIGKSTPTIKRHIDILVSEGELERVGSRKSGYWQVINLE